jgi:hypothetical protein
MEIICLNLNQNIYKMKFILFLQMTSQLKLFYLIYLNKKLKIFKRKKYLIKNLKIYYKIAMKLIKKKLKMIFGFLLFKNVMTIIKINLLHKKAIFSIW